jgi:hypothetical protein
MSNTSGEKCDSSQYKIPPYCIQEVTFTPSSALKKFVKKNHPEMVKSSFIQPLHCEIPQYIAISLNKLVDPASSAKSEVKLIKEKCLEISKKSNYKQIHLQFPVHSAKSNKIAANVRSPNPAPILDKMKNPLLKDEPQDVDGCNSQMMEVESVWVSFIYYISVNFIMKYADSYFSIFF